MSDKDTPKLSEQLMVRLTAVEKDEMDQLAAICGNNTPSALGRFAVRALIEHYIESGRSITFPLKIRFESPVFQLRVAEDVGNYSTRRERRRHKKEKPA
ncbi:MAG: hypothetical protein Q8M02_10475 [Candidatus Didemnitutus sp.]|nr:hypothetical protein [Candidatus Didemnitutus sp.]